MTHGFHTDETVLADRERVGKALREGGYATITVRSLETGRHVTLTFSAKKRGKNGRFVSRATKEGRVGMLDADTVFVDDPNRDAVGRFDPKTGEFKAAANAAPGAVWAATKLLAWTARPIPALEDHAEVFMALKCDTCARKLTDPVSIERGRGPECAGKATGSKYIEPGSAEAGGETAQQKTLAEIAEAMAR